MGNENILVRRSSLCVAGMSTSLRLLRNANGKDMTLDFRRLVLVCSNSDVLFRDKRAREGIV